MSSSAPLAGQTVVVTRPRHQAAKLSDLLRARGATVIERPTIALALVTGEELAAVDAALHELARGGFEVLLLTSPSAVELFAARASALALPLVPAGVRAFAIGAATAAALRARGVGEIIIAAEATSEGLRDAVTRALGGALAGVRVLLPQAREARDVLVEGLRGAGGRVHAPVLYDTVPRTDGEALPPGRIDWLTFTSPSAVRGFVQRYGVLTEPRVACIGWVTKAEAERAGFRVSVAPEAPALEGMVEAMVGARDGCNS